MIDWLVVCILQFLQLESGAKSRGDYYPTTSHLEFIIAIRPRGQRRQSGIYRAASSDEGHFKVKRRTRGAPAYNGDNDEDFTRNVIERKRKREIRVS